MKQLTLLLVGLIMSCAIFAQSSDNEEQVVKIESYNLNAYRQNEVIVKFKDNSSAQIRAPRRAQFSTTGVTAVDQMFQALGVDSVEELMPQTGSRRLPARIRTYNGDDIQPKNLGKLYLLKLNPNQTRSVYQIVDTLKNLAAVEYAEPNFIVYCMTTGVQDSTAYVAEPLYSQQWGPAAINLPALWAKPKVTTKRPVIAILDTGVDINHPDLQANIWTNSDEQSGESDEDDDDNGFTDDVHGWDFINNRATIADYNGHGTHCAGIAAAVGNNGIGITGANPDAYIMPVVVMQSNGTGDVATIIRGIDYASANGADVISMSIGGYGYSLAEEQALGRAYANAVLVAAAGNDYTCIYEHICSVNKSYGSPMYPAALSFVLGVEASTNMPDPLNPLGNIASFSNYDDDGPTYSAYSEDKLYNYELRAPGTSIYSTFPNGRYKSLSGTSMACPLAAGAISRLLQCKTDSALVSKEVLFGDLIQSRNGLGNIDMLSVYNCNDSTRQPSLELVSTAFNDTTAGGDGDGRYDAGETIELYPTLRNTYGFAQNIKIWIKFGFENQGDWVDEDTTLYTLYTDTVSFGRNLSSYAKMKSANPIRFKLDTNVVDGRKINLTLFAVCDNAADTMSHYFTIDVENGVEISGVISEDLTLYPNTHYIVTHNVAISAGVTLTIKPGTVIRFRDNTGLSLIGRYTYFRDPIYNKYCVSLDTVNSARLIANGTPDSMIVFTKAEGCKGIYYVTLGRDICRVDGCKVKDTLEKYGIIYNEIEYAVFEESNYENIPFVKYAILSNCIIKNIGGNHTGGSGYENHFENCVFTNCSEGYIFSYGIKDAYNCNIINNSLDKWTKSISGTDCEQLHSCNIYGNTQYDTKYCCQYSASEPSFYTPEHPSYWGTTKESTAREQIRDILVDYGYGQYDLSNKLNRPNAKAHGCVWKVLVNGWDAQDEYDSLPPIGVGNHTCAVYFNRAMDTAVTPYITFGVREPYTQHSVNANGSWSADSTIYTTSFSIDAKTASDGLNRLYVADAQDPDHFEIPLENTRFNMNIQATGSMSTGLMAEAGLGKVKLMWETDEEDFEDLLGYNIFRWTDDTIWNRYYDYDKGEYVREYSFDTTMVNTELIDAADTAFIDYDVIPGKAYYYVIKQMTTSLESYSMSNPVTATPLTSIKGDANGSMTVDVADVVTEVNYMMGSDPEPFIFEAADVNEDSTINVLDVVGTVNIIMSPENQSQAIDNSPVYYYVENGVLYLESDIALGGVQVMLTGNPESTTITAESSLDEMEKISLWAGNRHIFMAYSMSGKCIPVGTFALLNIGDAEITDLILSDTRGNNIAAICKTTTALSNIECVQMMRCYPNPFRDEVIIQYVVGRTDAQSVQFVVTDITGRTVATLNANATYGNETMVWRPGNELMNGVYFITLYVDGRKIQTEKIIRQ